MTKTKTTKQEGPNLFKRDANGLLSNIDYHFSEDGSVNWRAMIKNEHLFPNRDWFKNRKQDMPRSVEGLKDHQLLIKLGGIKELARLRGFSSVSYETVKCELDHVAVICKIVFTGNYETNGEEVSFQDIANATVNNTSDFGQIFLETIACNRAFVRCVRNFLNVHIVGDDEINKNNGASKPSISAGLTPHSILSSAAESKLNCSSFEDFKHVLRDWWREEKYRHEEVSEWSNWEDIPPSESRLLLKLVNG